MFLRENQDVSKIKIDIGWKEEIYSCVQCRVWEHGGKSECFLQMHGPIVKRHAVYFFLTLKHLFTDGNVNMGACLGGMRYMKKIHTKMIRFMYYAWVHSSPIDFDEFFVLSTCKVLWNTFSKLDMLRLWETYAWRWFCPVDMLCSTQSCNVAVIVLLLKPFLSFEAMCGVLFSKMLNFWKIFQVFVFKTWVCICKCWSSTPRSQIIALILYSIKNFFFDSLHSIFSEICCIRLQ